MKIENEKTMHEISLIIKIIIDNLKRRGIKIIELDSLFYFLNSGKLNEEKIKGAIKIKIELNLVTENGTTTKENETITFRKEEVFSTTHYSEDFYGERYTNNDNMFMHITNEESMLQIIGDRKKNIDTLINTKDSVIEISIDRLKISKIRK